MTFPICFNNHVASERDEYLANCERRTAAVLRRIHKETALLEQHERNEARSFHRWLTQTRPEDPIVKQMERDHPVLLEPEERHAKRACPACRERA